MNPLVATLLIIQSAQGAALPINPLGRAPTLDGRVTDAEWSAATLISDFRQRAPTEGAAPSERTEVLIGYTDDALYIALRAHDSQPQRITANIPTSARDNPGLGADDQFVIAIDNRNDGANGLWFGTNAQGARSDVRFRAEGSGGWDPSWNGEWRVASGRDERGWYAEVEIPFATLEVSPTGRVIMGMNLFRRHIRTGEALFSPLIGSAYQAGTPNVSVARKIMLTF